MLQQATIRDNWGSPIGVYNGNWIYTPLLRAVSIYLETFKNLDSFKTSTFYTFHVREMVNNIIFGLKHMNRTFVYTYVIVDRSDGSDK